MDVSYDQAGCLIKVDRILVLLSLLVCVRACYYFSREALAEREREVLETFIFGTAAGRKLWAVP
jgi:NO-binding membrane sensor protein with MHYT domain